MTILEALIGECDNSVIINRVLIDRGLNPADEYTASISDQVEIAKAFILRSWSTSPDFSESKLSITYKSSDIRKEADRIFRKYGLDDEISSGIPGVGNATNQW